MDLADKLGYHKILVLSGCTLRSDVDENFSGTILDSISYLK